MHHQYSAIPPAARRSKTFAPGGKPQACDLEELPSIIGGRRSTEAAAGQVAQVAQPPSQRHLG
jgi:hypothetical protein